MEADHHDEHDSTFGGDRDSLASSSTSLMSAITRYQFEHGRRYHAYQAGSYHFPNDEQELNRMDLEHHNQLLQLNGKLHLCPLQDPEEILDLGTGTGIWAMDMADKYPNAQVIGTDLSPEQPHWTPPNCRFEVDDFNLDWTFGESRFDFIHHRYLMGSIADQAKFYKEAYNALKPGGWLEIVEMHVLLFTDDDSIPKDSALAQWGRCLQEAFAKIGKDVPEVEWYAETFKKQGLQNVQWTTLKRPTNDWPKDPRMKEIGQYCCLNFLEGLEGFTIAPFTRILGWSMEEVNVLLARVRAEVMKRNIHAYHKGVVCYGQKPELPVRSGVWSLSSSFSKGNRRSEGFPVHREQGDPLHSPKAFPIFEKHTRTTRSWASKPLRVEGACSPRKVKGREDDFQAARGIGSPFPPNLLKFVLRISCLRISHCSPLTCARCSSFAEPVGTCATCIRLKKSKGFWFYALFKAASRSKFGSSGLVIAEARRVSAVHRVSNPGYP
nr:secondary metabolism regulator lae1 [Quercus suber]